MFIVVGYSYFVSKKGNEMISLSVNYECSNYNGYKAKEIIALKSAVLGDIAVGSIVNLGYSYKSDFCNSIVVVG